MKEKIEIAIDPKLLKWMRRDWSNGARVEDLALLAVEFCAVTLGAPVPARHGEMSQEEFLEHARILMDNASPL